MPSYHIEVRQCSGNAPWHWTSLHRFNLFKTHAIRN